MNPAASYRGQPLVALVLLIGGWVMMRAMLFEGGTAHRPAPFDPPQAVAWEGTRRETIGPIVAVPEGPEQAFAAPRSPFPAASLPRPAMAPAMRNIAAPEPTFEPWLPPAATGRKAPETPSPPVPVQVSAAHQLLWMAAVANLPLPPGLLVRPAAMKEPARFNRQAADPRWSADGWFLLRRGGGAAPAGGFSPPSYGASQAGAVARYRLAPRSPHRPALHLRASAALNGTEEREAAFGLSARPIGSLPVTLALEARVIAGPGGGTRVRPAAFAHTELAPVDLPLGARADFYGQAGYVGGDFASAFADGQLRVDRRLTVIGAGELRAGGGAWGGAQKGASRLDIGPTATVGMPLGGTGGARLGLDWRFRVAGNAAPSSGPALTLSAGF